MKQDQWELLANYFANELSPEEEIVFKEWLGNDAANQKTLEEAQKLWKESQKGTNQSDEEFLAVIGTNPDEVWSRVVAETKKVSQTKPIIYWTYRIAASVLLVLSIGWLYTRNYDQADPLVSSLEHFQSEQKGMSVVLSDGSKVWLNKGAVMHYPKTFETDQRIVTLEGEGYFEVSRDESRPFLIQTNESIVRVLGTTFNVKAPDEEVVVTVTSGSVSLASKDESERQVILEKGDVGIFNSLNGSLEKVKNLDLNFLSWKTGVFQFQNEPLQQVLQRMSEHYQHQITSDDKTLLSRKLTATFDNQSMNEVLSVICSVHDLKINTVDNETILSREK